MQFPLFTTTFDGEIGEFATFEESSMHMSEDDQEMKAWDGAIHTRKALSKI